ncbi:MAG: GSCFA domain-containing protein [Coleofasciculus sp.]|uniref:GSCFA domain-containing protein n=1 Tax=Coleofasciculus sp. TaxID=3100458 RepID=UPI003A4905B8
MVYAYNPDRSGLSEVKLLNLEPWRRYPTVDQLDPIKVFPRPDNLPRITKETPIASIGSCFARELKFWLKDNGFNFLQAGKGVCSKAGSARYDRVYNTYSLKQEFERAFGSFEPVEEWWEVEDSGTKHLLDPYRRRIAWENHQERKRELAQHKEEVRKAFTEAELIIITVGQAEIWYNKSDGSVFPLVPPPDAFDEQKHGFRLTTVEENTQNLQRIYDMISAVNPTASIIITVSPVPLRATFRHTSAVIANSASKAILRAAVDSFVLSNSDNVWYFPAYEMVKEIIVNPFKEDHRHVRPEAIASIMDLFASWVLEKKLNFYGHKFK